MNKQYLIGALVAVMASFLLISLQKNWIIINFSNNHMSLQDLKKSNALKKSITVYFYKNSKWHEEKTDILWLADDQKNIEQITRNWLNILEDEGLLEKKISIQYVITANHTFYISFDYELLDPQWSTHQKYMLIKSLLKTLEQEFNDFKIYFLVHSKPMKDYHLDFSHAWVNL